jgi:hypothetical protein
MATNRTSPKKGKVVDIPTAPTIGTATAGAESATVEYTAATKGGPATTFTALSNPGSFTGTGSSSPITVSGLTAGTAYTFTVRGSNATGSGEYSSASNSITPEEGTAFASLATVSVGSGGVSSISFTSIPSTYKHLQIRAVARTNNANSFDNIKMTYNADGGTNYDGHQMYAFGTSVASQLGGSNPFTFIGYVAGNSGTGSVFSGFIVDVLDYSSTNKYKGSRYLCGEDLNGSGSISLGSNIWKSTSAINRIDLTPSDGSLFNQYSHFALYGIKG